MQNELATANQVSFLWGGGEMGALMRSQDWSQTPLGEVEHWPQSLRSALSICLNSRFPIAIYWGQDCILLYNDAWRPIVGDKHSWALGHPAREVWSEIWDDIGPELASVLATGEGTLHNDDLLSMHRFGYTEECFFDYTFNPIQGQDGVVDGVFNVVSETTYRVLNDRRARLLREVASRTGITRSVDESCALMLEAFQSDRLDIPLALLYLIDSDRQQAHLFDRGEVISNHPVIPQVIDLTAADDLQGWSIAHAARTAQPQEISNLVERFGVLSGSPWTESPQEAMVLPIAAPGQSKMSGVLVAVASPRRRLDDNYRDFFTQIARQIAIAIANARAYEEEHKRAEVLAELDRAKTVFFSNVSHEFRTPLTLMLSPLEELSHSLAQRLQPDEREQLHLIQRNGLRLQKLVNTLLDFSRIEARRVQAFYEPIDLAAYTAELASTFRSLIEQAGMKLEIDCPPIAEPVYADREMWEKIVLNLLSNAFKFTFAGRISVRLRLVGNAVELNVSDTGVGIPTAELPRLFERFHRVSGMRSRTYEGSGIGLALVQELVKLHQGTIEATSVEGEGTCFTLSIPTGTAHLPPDRIGATCTLVPIAVGANPYLEEAARWLPQERSEFPVLAPQLDSESSIQLSTFNPQTARILLADDNADMRDYVRRLLKQYEVEAVSDGIAALSAIRQQMPDLVLTDVMMPNLDGMGLLQALRSDPQTREIPIILLSARAGEEARLEGLEAGADDYLIKPFSARELLVRVEATLKLAQLRQEAMQQEQALRWEAETAQQRVETILSSIRDGFFVLDRDWRFTYVNDRLCEMAGKSREELLGHNNWELFPDAVGTDIYVQFHRALNERTPLQFEYLYLPWNRWFEYWVYPSSDGLTIFTVEITDRKQAEAKLHETVTLLNAISDYSLDIIFAKDREGRLLFVNPAISPYFGKSVAELIGKNEFFFIQDRAAAEAIRANDLRIMQSGVAEVLEEPIIINGSLRTFVSTKAPLRDARGNIVGIVGIGHDMTDRKKAEAALAERNKELDSFVHTVSHDLKAPLRAISNLSEWIEDDLEGQLPPENQQQLQLLRTRVKRMESMINSLLVYARAGRQEAPLEPVNVAELLDEIIDSLAPPQSFSIEIEPSMPTLNTQRLFLSQVFANLISNAIKHHTSVEGHLNISVLEQRDFYEFRVRDDGPGIAPEDSANIFEIFQTLKARDEGDNTGVGLAIVKKIVEREKGTIRLESQLGQGATFCFTWPKHHSS